MQQGISGATRTAFIVTSSVLALSVITSCCRSRDSILRQAVDDQYYRNFQAFAQDKRVVACRVYIRSDIDPGDVAVNLNGIWILPGVGGQYGSRSEGNLPLGWNLRGSVVICHMIDRGVFHGAVRLLSTNEEAGFTIDTQSSDRSEWEVVVMRSESADLEIRSGVNLVGGGI